MTCPQKPPQPPEHCEYCTFRERRTNTCGFFQRQRELRELGYKLAAQAQNQSIYKLDDRYERA